MRSIDCLLEVRADFINLRCSCPLLTQSSLCSCLPIRVIWCKIAQHVHSSSHCPRDCILRGIQYPRADPDGANGKRLPGVASDCGRQRRRIGGLRRATDAARCNQSLGIRRACEQNGGFQLNLWIPDPAPKRDRVAEDAVRHFLSNWGPEVAREAGDVTLPDFGAQCDAI